MTPGVRGTFITLEGGEGAGKSTQIQRLQERMLTMGHDVVVTREPGGSPRAERIRGLLLEGRAERFGPFAEALLFAAARADHVETTIRPALARGAVVLCDRFADSTRVYQGTLGRIDAKTLAGLEDIAVGGTRPDLTLVFDIPASRGLERVAERQRRSGTTSDRFEAQDLAFHEAVREAFLTIARAEPQRCAVIDAGADPDSVEGAVWAAVEARLPTLIDGDQGTEQKRSSRQAGARRGR